MLNYVSVVSRQRGVLREITYNRMSFRPVYTVPPSVSTYNNIPKHVNTLEWQRRTAVGPFEADGQPMVVAEPTSATGRRDVVSPTAT